MSYTALLRKAQRTLKAGQYREVIRLLEPKVPIYTDDPLFYYLLGCACYHQGDIGGSHLYLQRGIACSFDDLNLRLMLAAVALRRRDTAQALQMWLEVIELNPDNRRARQGINALKSLDNEIELSRFVRSSRFKKLLPKNSGRYINFWKFWLILFTLGISVFGVWFFWPWIADQFDHYPITRATDEPFIFFQLDPISYLGIDATARTTLNLAEVRNTMDKARTYFNNYEDDLAGREINRILFSNASMQVKDQAKILRSMLRPPSFDTYTAGFTFNEVAREPWLYEGLHVLWRGRISGLNTTADRIAFNLLVGYEDGQTMEGMTPVAVRFETFLDPSLTTVVLGRVIVTTDDSFHLEAVSITQLVRPNQSLLSR
jgi:tetratricopeptide (TPR) repeat protein